MSQTQGQMSQGPMPWNPKTVKPTEREDSMCRRKAETLVVKCLRGQRLSGRKMQSSGGRGREVPDTIAMLLGLGCLLGQEGSGCPPPAGAECSPHPVISHLPF